MSNLKIPEEALHYAHQVAGHRGWVVNPDGRLLKPLLQGLVDQSQRWNLPLCPCRDVDDVEKNRDIVCPCIYAAPDIAEHGQCYCGLFLSPEKNPQDVASIPERRPDQH